MSWWLDRRPASGLGNWSNEQGSNPASLNGRIEGQLGAVRGAARLTQSKQLDRDLAADDGTIILTGRANKVE